MSEVTALIAEIKSKGLLRAGDKLEELYVVAARIQADNLALKAQRDALAAENASLTEFIQKDCCVYRSGMVVNAEAYLPVTPATDAYLNSVRADALESFAHHQRVIADSVTGGEAARVHRITACRAEDFAAKIRAGEPS